MRKFHVKLFCLALFGATTVGCQAVVDKVAERGNQYCDVRPDSADAVVNGINDRLAAAGARFEISGLTCLE